MYAQKQPAKSKQNPSKQNEKVSSNVVRVNIYQGTKA